uniref:ABC transporter substrate-binding protein n=1 Tax=candidate division WWE3 bacterium TaxID=2053526 RepID=A0A831YTA5_UNCKA
MIRYLLLILLLGALGGWFALRVSWESVFTEGLVGQPVDLIPGQGPDNPVDELLERLLFRSLFSYAEDGEIRPDLAESYQVSADGKVYTVSLKESFWRDGRPVTSSDVAFTFARDSAFADVVIEQEGGREVRFWLKNPLASFLDVLTRPIAPAHFRELSLQDLGNGDFTIVQVEQEGETVKELMLKNLSEAPIKNIRFKFFVREDDLIAAAQSGEVDALSALNFSDPSFSLYRAPIFDRYFSLFFNLNSQNNLIKNKGFRRAAALKSPLPAGGVEVNGPFSGTWAQAGLPFPKFSADPVGQFSGAITITVVDSGRLPEIAQTIAQSWRENLGIQAEVRLIAAATLNRVLEQRDFEAIFLGQTVERDPDRYGLWHSSAKDFPGQNVSGYSDPRADRALEEARKTADRAARLSHYLNFQRLFIEDNPAVLLYHPVFPYWVSRKFTGVNLTPIFSPEERFWNFREWKLAFPARGGKTGQ